MMHMVSLKAASCTLHHFIKGSILYYVSIAVVVVAAPLRISCFPTPSKNMGESTPMSLVLVCWRKFEGKVCLLKLRLQEQSLCILQMYTPNAETQPFLDEVDVALPKITSAELIVLLGDFNAHMGTDDKT